MPTSPHAGAFAEFARLRIASAAPERFDARFIRTYKMPFYRAFRAWLNEPKLDELVTPSTS